MGPRKLGLGRPHIHQDSLLGQVPIPEDRRDIVFTNAVYVVDCIHDFEGYCTCSGDDSIEWELVEYFNINDVPNI